MVFVEGRSLQQLLRTGTFAAATVLLFHEEGNGRDFMDVEAGQESRRKAWERWLCECCEAADATVGSCVWQLAP